MVTVTVNLFDYFQQNNYNDFNAYISKNPNEYVTFPKEANLSKQNFYYFNLNKSVFEHDIIEGVTFKHTQLGRVSFDNKTTKDVIFDHVEISGSSFKKTKLVNVVFQSCTIRAADFSDSKLDDVKFEKCNLYGSKLEKSVFNKVSIDDSELNRVDFSYATILAEFNGCDFSQTKWLKTVIGSRTSFNNITFNKGHLVQNDFSEQIIRSKLSWSTIRFMSTFPLFGVSWAALLFSLIMVNTIEVINTSQFIQFIKYPIPIPNDTLTIIVSAMMLAMGTTLYKIFCPHRIQEFSETEWVEAQHHPRILYIEKDLKHFDWYMLSLFFLSVGGLIALCLAGHRLVMAIGYIQNRYILYAVLSAFVIYLGVFYSDKILSFLRKFNITNIRRRR